MKNEGERLCEPTSVQRFISRAGVLLLAPREHRSGYSGGFKVLWFTAETCYQGLLV